MKKITILSLMLFSAVQGAEEAKDDKDMEPLTTQIHTEVNRVLEKFRRNMEAYYERTRSLKRISAIPADAPEKLGEEPEDYPHLATPQPEKEDVLGGEELGKMSKTLTVEDAQQNLETARKYLKQATRWLWMNFDKTDYDFKKYDYRDDGIPDNRTRDQKETDIRRYKLLLGSSHLLDVARAKQEFLKTADEVTRKSAESGQPDFEEASDVSNLRQALKNAEKYLREELNIQKPTPLQITVIDELKACMKPQSGDELIPETVKRILEIFILHAIWDPIGAISSSILTEINRQNLEILTVDPEVLKDKVDLGLRLQRTKKEKFGLGSVREVTVYPTPEKIERTVSLLRKTLKERQAQYLKDHKLGETKESLEEYKKYMDKARFQAILSLSSPLQE